MIWLIKLFPIKLLSTITGFLADVKFPRWLLNSLFRCFIRLFSINTDETKLPIADYKNFNAIFTRELKEGSRPIDPNPNAITSPVDGRVVEHGNIEGLNALQVKGVPYSVDKLIRHSEFSQRFVDGAFITLYLSPRDYHRIHTHCRGKAVGVEYNRGALFPVNNLGLYHIQNLFTINERLTTFFDTPFGFTAMVKVGATNVGRIKTIYPLPWSKTELMQKHLFSPLNSLAYDKGDEIARFELGSTVILLFEKNSIQFLKTIQPDQFFQMGQAIAMGIV